MQGTVDEPLLYRAFGKFTGCLEGSAYVDSSTGSACYSTDITIYSSQKCDKTVPDAEPAGIEVCYPEGGVPSLVGQG